jgi:beta-lactamase superfamily II metal-dependent hydrolase
VSFEDYESGVSVGEAEGWLAGYAQGEAEREALARSNSELRSEVLRLNHLLSLLGEPT